MIAEAEMCDRRTCTHYSEIGKYIPGNMIEMAGRCQRRQNGGRDSGCVEKK